MNLNTSSITRNLKKILLECTTKKEESISFSAHRFFSLWFRKAATPYYFLFQKNLTRTNIQFAELISLIKLHTTYTKTNKKAENLHFILVSDFIEGVQHVINDLAKSNPTKEDLCSIFQKLYAEVLNDLILLDVLHGSCSVFCPGHMQLNLLKVCGESGYIHSCGHNVYARELAKADHQDFKRDLLEYIHKIHGGKKIFLVVYSHEDFTRWDRDYSSSLRGGLDDVKVYAEKYYIGSKPMVRVLQELASEAPNRIQLAEAGNYHSHDRQRKRKDILQGRTMWLIIDRAVDPHTGTCGDAPFLICYDQKYKNESPLHLFDENKPAWVAHTTIPHTLAGAMLNISRPNWPEKEVQIYDPFCGTGTTALEALKFRNVSITCNDKSPIASQLLKDNLAFFGEPADELGKIHKALQNLSKEDCTEYQVTPKEHTSIPSPYVEALHLFDEVAEKHAKDDNDEWFDISAEVAKKVKDSSSAIRLRFYLALRTKLRHVGAFERKSEQWMPAYRHEAYNLAFQLGELCDLRKRLGKLNANAEAVCVTRSTYSDACTINPLVFSDEGTNLKRLTITSLDAGRRTKGMYDLIITDPPYGFNNKTSPLALARMLTNALDVLIGSLKPDGQLVIALPDRSHSGGRIPLFATRVWVTQQVISKAQSRGLETSLPATILPRLEHLFHPPYYWKSEKALTRAILHFQFRRKKASPKDPPLLADDVSVEQRA